MEETNGYIDLYAHTEITKETNVWIDFKQAVAKGSVSDTMKMTFGADPLTNADLEIIKSSGDDCFADNRCHALLSSTFYLFEPAAALADADTDTSNSTEVTVSFGRGTFDYVNAFTHTFITNRTEYEGHAPEILAYSIGATVFRGTDAYYETAADYLASAAVTAWFDTQVTGVTGKHVASRGRMLEAVHGGAALHHSRCQSMFDIACIWVLLRIFWLTMFFSAALMRASHSRLIREADVTCVSGC